MSVLPDGRPLHQVLPDLNELMADPHAYLSEAPLAIGPRRFYRLAGLFALPGVALLLSCMLAGKADSERIALGVGLLTGAGLWLGWSLWLRGHELVLHPDGVEVNYRDSSVRAPWALFHGSGRPFLAQSDSPQAGLLVPINPAAVPFVELRRHGMIARTGLDVTAPQWRLTGLGEVCLPGRYEVDSRDLGELLVWLGGQLGRNLPAGARPDGENTVRLVEPTADPAGWFTVPLTRFRLPTCCCGCGGPRDTVLHAQLGARLDRFLGFLLGTWRSLEVGVPLCEACREAALRRQRIGAGLGLIAGTILGTALGGLVGTWRGEGRQLALYLGALLGLSLGALAGSALGIVLSRRLPVRFRRYNPVRGTVSVRFDNPVIAARVISALREAEARAAAGSRGGDEREPL
jgi:hypothetical protein